LIVDGIDYSVLSGFLVVLFNTQRFENDSVVSIMQIKWLLKLPGIVRRLVNASIFYVHTRYSKSKKIRRKVCSSQKVAYIYS